MSNLLFDLRFGWRSLTRTPGLALVAILTLALGVGVNVSVFAFVNALFFGPIPFEEPDRSAYLWSTELHAGRPRQQVSPADLRDWRDQSDTFEAMAGFVSRRLDLSGDPPERLLAVDVTDDFFAVLGAEPLLGHAFTGSGRDEERRCAVVLGHGLWQRQLGGDRGAIGRPLRLDDEICTVVGVARPDFWFPSREVDLWRRMPLEGATDRSRAELQVIGRLAPSSSLGEARTELEVIAGRLAQAHPETNAERGVEVVPISWQLLGRSDRIALAMLGLTVVFILVMSCVNVANLLLVRGVERREELGVRVALGADRRRLVRQLLAEGLVLAVLAGAAGALFARWAAAVLIRVFPHQTPDPAHVVDGRVLVFALAVSLATIPLFALLPALRASKMDVRTALQESETAAATGRRTRRLTKLLVVGETTLALALLAVSGLMIRTLVALERVDPGFRAEEVVTAGMDLSPDAGDSARTAFLSQVLERVGAIPGVEAASAVSRPPFAHGTSVTRFAIDGVAAGDGEAEPRADVLVAAPGYFETLGLTVLQGRGFPAGAPESTERVAVVNEALVRRYAPAGEPLGLRIRLEDPERPGADGEWLSVVGVVSDVRYRHTAFDPMPQVYLPYAQRPVGSLALLVRTADPNLQVADAMRREVGRLDRGRPLYDIRRLDGLLADLLSVPKTFVALLGVFGAVALLLAAVGVCGVVSSSVGQRMREMAVRQAMGARTGDIRRMILWEGVKLALTGAALGLLLALGLGRLISGMLYGIQPHDPLTFGVATGLLAALVLVASWIPARRATRIEVAETLRTG